MTSRFLKSFCHSPYENLRQKLKGIPKYGQEDKEADEMMSRLCSDVCEIYDSYVTRFGGRGKAVVFTFEWAACCGSIIGATADGNFAGHPVAHGVTPQSGAMTKGITAAINSCTSIPFEDFSAGASTMWDMDEGWATTDVIKTIFTVFFEKGGQIFQGNMTDVKSLELAMENPEDYPDLMVRVGGFSARFIHLNSEVQLEIINRVRHNK